MAELILTEAERFSLNFLEWDDAALGKAVKQVAIICNDTEGKHALKVTGAGVFLISEAVRNGAAELTLNIQGAVNGHQELGDWKITIEKS